MRRAVIVPFVLVLGLAAGCAGHSHGPGVATAHGATGGPSASPTASVDPEEARRQFAQCMREHGVDVPDPDTDGSGGGGPMRIQASAGSGAEDAVAACQKYLPAGKFATPDAQQLEQMRQFAKCMRDHGVDVPDPNANGGVTIHKGTGSGGDAGVNPDDPAFKAAMQACQDKLPGKGAGTTVTGGGK
jgi:hypothetical protein